MNFILFNDALNDAHIYDHFSTQFAHTDHEVVLHLGGPQRSAGTKPQSSFLVHAARHQIILVGIFMQNQQKCT